MSSKLVDAFIAEQMKLISPPAKPAKANKALVNPANKKVMIENDLEATYNTILEKKPANKTVLKFLQDCINKSIEED